MRLPTRYASSAEMISGAAADTSGGAAPAGAPGVEAGAPLTAAGSECPAVAGMTEAGTAQKPTELGAGDRVSARRSTDGAGPARGGSGRSGWRASTPVLPFQLALNCGTLAYTGCGTSIFHHAADGASRRTLPRRTGGPGAPPLRRHYAAALPSEPGSRTHSSVSAHRQISSTPEVAMSRPMLSRAASKTLRRNSGDSSPTSRPSAERKRRTGVGHKCRSVSHPAVARLDHDGAPPRLSRKREYPRLLRRCPRDPARAALAQSVYVVLPSGRQLELAAFDQT